MKKNIIIGTLLLSGFTILTSCHDLNLNPLSNGSTDTWYSSETEIQMAVNDLYRIDFWVQDEGGVGGTDWSDDRVYREQLTAFQNATLNGQNSAVTDLWAKQYKVIARANSVILKADRAIKNGASANKVNQLVGEARFHRGCAYSKLICKFGDVPLVEGELSIDEGLQQGRTDKATVLQFIYDDFDAAASVLPTSVSGQRRATKGAALAFKARIALYMGDYNTAATASKAVMDLGVYKLHSNYGNLFLSSTKNSEESVFLIPRSIEYKVYVNIRGQLPRNSGGYAVPDPTWDLLASYTCTDGLPIEVSIIS